MAHMFNVMAALTGQLNVLSKYYINKQSVVRSITPPKFLTVAISRATDNRPREEILTNPEDENCCPVVDIASIVDTGDNFMPIYVCVVDNIKIPIVDRVPIIVNHNDITGPGVGIIVAVPMAMFKVDASIKYSATVLKEVYFALANMDPNVQYTIDSSMINYSESDKVRVSTYDLTMAYVALGCIYINLRSWYKGKNNRPLDAGYVFDAFEDGELDETVIENISSTLNRNAKGIGVLRDAVANGELLLYALYDVEDNK